MKRAIFTIFLFCSVLSFTNAQLWKSKRFESSLGIGPSFFFGDIGGYSISKNILGLRDFTFKQMRFDINGNLKYRLTQEFSLRLSLTTGFFHATDVRGSNENRNFESSTFFVEPLVMIEYYFIKNKSEDSYLFTKGNYVTLGGLFKSLDFYVFTGIGGLGYSVNGNSKLENFRINHGGFAAVIPVGLGSTLIYSPKINFGFEITGRYAFSDYLDGYTSQYSSANDVYYFFNFTITYKMANGPKGWPSFK
jgi:hypothetical protein